MVNTFCFIICIRGTCNSTAWPVENEHYTFLDVSHLDIFAQDLHSSLHQESQPLSSARDDQQAWTPKHGRTVKDLGLVLKKNLF